MAETATPPRRAAPPPAAVGRTSLLAGKRLLCRRQILGGLTGKSRIGDDLAVAGGGEPGHADIYADLPAGRGERAGGYVIAGQHHVPAAAFPLETDRLDLALYGAVGVDLDVADALKVDAAQDRKRVGQGK